MGFLNTCKLYLHSIFKHKAVLSCVAFVQSATIFCCLYLFSSAYYYYCYASNICLFYLEYTEPTCIGDVIDSSISLYQLDSNIIVKIYLDEDCTIYINLNSNNYAGVGNELNYESYSRQVYVSIDDNYSIGDTIIIFDEAYTVVGVGYNTTGFAINYAGLDYSQSVFGIEICDYTIKSANDQLDRIDYIIDNFGITPTYAEAPSFIHYLIANISDTLRILVVMLIASLGFTLGLQYFIAQNKTTIKVLRICGMDALHAQLILLCLGLIITACSCILGSVVYACYFKFYVATSGAYVSQLTFANYLAINAFMFVMPTISALTVFKNKAIRGAK